MTAYGTSSANGPISLETVGRDLSSLRSHHYFVGDGAKAAACPGCRRGSGAALLVLPRLIKRAILGMAIVTVLFLLGRSIVDSLMARLDYQRAVHADRTAVSAGVQAQVKPEVLLVYRNKDGRRTRVLADEERFSSFVRQQVAELENARTALRARAAPRLHSNAAPVFAAMQRRVDTFGDWYFAWGTSYDLVAKALMSTASNAVRPGVMGVAEAVEYDLERYIERQYRDIVLQPEHSDVALEQSYKDTLSGLYEGFVSSMEAFDQAFQNFVLRNTDYSTDPLDTQRVRLAFDWDNQAKKLSVAGYEQGFARPVIGVTLISGTALAGRAGGAAAGKVIEQATMGRSSAAAVGGMGARLATPYLGRLAAAATGATIGAVSGPAGAILGAVAGLGCDYALNEAVEFVQRAGFEAEVLSTLKAHEHHWQVTMLSSLEGAVDIWFGDVTQLLVRYQDGR